MKIKRLGRRAVLSRLKRAADTGDKSSRYVRDLQARYKEIRGSDK